MEQYLKFNSMKALYILILQSLLGKFEIGANKISWEKSNIEVGWIMFILVPLVQF